MYFNLVKSASCFNERMMVMSPEIKERIAELNKQIKAANIMISYHQDRLKHYKEEKQQLNAELATLKDDFWEDDG